MTTHGCHFAEPTCSAKLWQCHGCKKRFCDKHGNVTERGSNECRACCQRRKDASLFGSDTGVKRHVAKTNVLDRLKIR